MEELTQLTIEQFLEKTADRKPTPGGGSVAATVGALAVALGRMVTAYSTPCGSQTSSEPIVRLTTALRTIDEMMRALITEDAAAYLRLRDAARQSSDTAGKAAHQQAVLAAIAVPMKMAALSSRALSALDQAKHDINPHLLSDLAIAATLAAAVCESSRYLVQANAGSLEDPQRRQSLVEEIDEIVGHGSSYRTSIASFVVSKYEC